MQPVIAAAIGIILFNEKMTVPKMLAASLVFTGVFLVNRNHEIRKGAGTG
jgi:drug/metabolite transporter (DMT)-like permease